MKRIVPALLFTLVCAATAQAVEYNQIQPDKSRIGFVYRRWCTITKCLYNKRIDSEISA